MTIGTKAKGFMDNIFSNVKQNWDKSQEEKNEKKRVYNEAYKTAEVDAIQKKAVADANAKYAPASKKKKEVIVSPEEAKRRAAKAKEMNPFGRF